MKVGSRSISFNDMKSHQLLRPLDDNLTARIYPTQIEDLRSEIRS